MDGRLRRKFKVQTDKAAHLNTSAAQIPRSIRVYLILGSMIVPIAV
jgi:hypothetical protein